MFADDARADRSSLLLMCVPWKMPGRKLLLHSCGPTTGWPGHRTTKPGRFWFSVPEAVGQPGAHARPDRLHVAAVHHQQRRLVIGDVGVHRADDADVVDAAADVRIEFADLDAALAVLVRSVNGELISGPVLHGRPGAWNDSRQRLTVAGFAGLAWDRRCRRATARRS